MAYIQAWRCDMCQVMIEGLADDGPPEGWWQLMQLGSFGTWASEHEMHFCSKACLDARPVGVELDE